jgi:3'(2'), 5'-bisphosphate nucleotidase
MADHDDHWLAAELATSAGELLLALRADLSDQGVSSAEMKDAGDKASHDHIMASLAERRPHDAVLSEEGKDDPARLGADRVWIVDPLDGTREFGEVPRTDWAVHIALVEDGVPTVGAVSLPGRRRTRGAARRPRRSSAGDLQPDAPGPSRRDRRRRARGRPGHHGLGRRQGHGRAAG